MGFYKCTEQIEIKTICRFLHNSSVAEKRINICSNMLILMVAVFQHKRSNVLFDSKHADLVAEYIKLCKRNDFVLHEVESHYNFYNNKGYIDVLVRKEKRGVVYWIAAEVKPVVMNLGEALRQVKKAKEYFRKSRADLFNDGKLHEISFPLVLADCDENRAILECYPESFEGIQVEFINTNSSAGSLMAAAVEINEAISRVRRKG